MGVPLLRPIIVVLIVGVLLGGFIAYRNASGVGGRTFYFSSSTGSDSNLCSQDLPCQTLTKVENLALSPGDGVAFKRGDVWQGGLVIDQSGSSAGRINFYGYGSSSYRPLITGGKNGDCIRINGSYVNVDNLEADGCGYAGLEIYGAHEAIQKSAIKSNVAGIRVAASASDVMIGGSIDLGNSIKGNNVLNVNTASQSSGAFGVLLNGPAVVTGNRISGSVASSQAYGFDGSAVEIFNASNTWVHHNTMIGNDTGVELGGTGSGNAIEYNKIESDVAATGDQQANGIVLPGSVTGTWISHDTIDTVGSNAQGIVCYSSCDAGTQVHDSAVASSTKAFYTDNGTVVVKGSVFNGTVQGVSLDASNSIAPVQWVAPPGDLHLQAASPAVDRGSVANFAADLDDLPIPSGAAPDSGAYELQTGTTTTTSSSSTTTTTPTTTSTTSTTSTTPTSTTSTTTTTSSTTTSGGSHVIAAVGDTCGGSGTSQQCGKTEQAIASLSPERFVHLGDYQYQNAGTNGATYQAGYQIAFDSLHGITIPTYGATHDTCDGSGAWECYPVSFMNSNGAPEVRGRLSDHEWGYSVDIGVWHVVVFNYRTDQGGSVASVTADLDAHPSQCLLAVDHAPVIGSSTSEHSTDEASAWRSTLVSHGVDLILNGHQHMYERNVDPSGFTEITDGEGGIGHYARTSVASTAVAYDSASFGPVKVVLSSMGWTSDFIPDAGASAFSDHASGGC